MNLSVLLVDDSAVQATTRRMILERAGYQVTVSLDAQAALALVSDGCESRYSLVITDHIMPSLSGAEFVTALREACQSMPVIVLSGMVEAESEYDDLDVEFHLKPFAPEELLATVARLIDEPPMVRTA